MNRLFALLGIITLSACSQVEEGNIRTAADYRDYLEEEELIIASESLYTLDVRVEKGSDEEYTIITEVEPQDGFYVVSAMAKSDLAGKFHTSSYNNDFVQIGVLSDEQPLSKLETNMMWEGEDQVIREKTTYSQTLKVLTNDDFIVPYNVDFVIEPRCTMENFYFNLFQKDGEVMIVQADGC